MSFRVAQAFNFRIGLKHLRLAVALDECNSLSRAANDLNISQPTATKLLQDLEAELKVTLFKRTNRGVVPTQIGAVLIRQAKLLLVELAHVGQTMQDMALGTGGRVVAGTLLTASSILLPRAIARLRAARPNVTIEVVESTNDVLIPRLIAGELDFIVGRLSEFRNLEEIDREAFYTEDVHIVARRDHPLVTKEQPTIEDYRTAEWILPPPETTLRRQVDRSFYEAGIVGLRCGVQSVSTLTNRRLVQTTDLLGIWPASLVEQDPVPDQFAILPLKLPSLSGAIGVSRRRAATLSPAAVMLIEELRAVADELVSANGSSRGG